MAVIMTVVILANIALALITNQSRLTHHQASRIQAFYAAQAGNNYAWEMLRTGAWPDTGALVETHVMCDGCTSAGPPSEVDEPDLPISIQQVDITIDDSDNDGNYIISSTATYTYTAP